MGDWPRAVGTVRPWGGCCVPVSLNEVSAGRGVYSLVAVVIYGGQDRQGGSGKERMGVS